MKFATVIYLDKETIIEIHRLQIEEHTVLWDINHQLLKFLNQTSDKIWYPIFELMKWYTNSTTTDDRLFWRLNK